MRKSILFVGGILAVFLLIQFISPVRNLGSINTEEDFIEVAEVPDALARIFLNSCYDCHSNYTNYPWYNRVAPVSWYLNKHIVDGKAHMNFSSWALLDKAQKISMLDEICSECSGGSMPLKSYLLIHGSARLSPGEIEAICNWTDEQSMAIMRSD